MNEAISAEDGVDLGEDGFDQVARHEEVVSGEVATGVGLDELLDHVNTEVEFKAMGDLENPCAVPTRRVAQSLNVHLLEQRRKPLS